MISRFRRTNRSIDRPETDHARPTGATIGDQLAAGGWMMPRSYTRSEAPAWTLVGTVSSPEATVVDEAGMVTLDGWSLDWWIGADDRWHLPSREAGVRQRLVDDAPVVETLVRIPGGDAVHRAYGIRSPRSVGDEWVVAEVHNPTPVPFAVALVIRPMVSAGVGAVSSITVEPTGGGPAGATGRDQPHLVRVDGRPSLLLPRRPARVAVGNRASGDVVDLVTSGRAGIELVEASCPDGLATMAMILPLTHTSTLRAVIPVGDVSGDSLDHPAVVPDAATVASGWEVHRRGPRLEIPETRIAQAWERARAQIHLAHDGEAVRRDGHRSPDLDPGATEVILGAFDVLDRPAEVGVVVARWADRMTGAGPEVDAMVLTAVARHWLLHRVDEMLDWMLPEVAAAVERIDKADRRGRLRTVASRRRAAEGLHLTTQLLAAAGQPDAAHEVTSLAERVAASLSTPEPFNAAERLQVASELAAAGDPAGHAAIVREVGDASATGAWLGPGPGGRIVGHDLAATGALILAVRNLLVAERPDGLALLPHHPDAWYGGGVEAHDVPTAAGEISYAIRWHGTRPALLWELSPHDATGPVTLTIPGLDPTWSTTEVRGETLLAEVAPPAGLEPVELVAEHPDIDPEMRRPGRAPETSSSPELPEGGSFS